MPYFAIFILIIFSIPAVILIFTFFILISNFVREKEKKEILLPYRKRNSLLSFQEKKFYKVIDKIAEDNNYLLFTKVRLEDLFWIPKNISSKERFGLRNRIKSRHVDFLICNKDKITPILGIELDDWSHASRKAKEKDKFINKVFTSAKLPLLRIETQKFYNPELILEEIKNKTVKTKK